MNTIGEISFQIFKKPKIEIWYYAYMYLITNYLYILTDLYIQEFRILISTTSILYVILPSSLRSLIPQKICTTCLVIWNSCLSPSPSQLSILMMFRYKYSHIQYTAFPAVMKPSPIFFLIWCPLLIKRKQKKWWLHCCS